VEKRRVFRQFDGLRAGDVPRGTIRDCACTLLAFRWFLLFIAFKNVEDFAVFVK
jgi:hypothetical protein